ncbi:MAG: glycogen synthase [Labilithrix sp.]|nr:glycogen synthase [Labilithrix sp.]MCW5814941.1 glycogen synthase [Labilithrix sp.]
MNVLFVSAEVAPFAKTGGLGDVGAALPRVLGTKGHDVRVVMPFYARVREKASNGPFETVLKDCVVVLGGTRIVFSVLRGKLPDSSVPVYFVRCSGLYDRQGIYTQDHDEHLRFAVLNWAALHICQRLQFRPDIVHVNDWQSALIPLLLRTMFAWDRLFNGTRTVLTIHNIGHQGTFGADKIADTGLADARDHFHQDQLREGRINFLLTGIMYANAITTVSPTYAREIQTPEHGVGLDYFLRNRREWTFGILNGIDDGEWNPETDTKIVANYSAENLDGKEANKKALLENAGLKYFPRVPVVGIVSRLAWQKGFDLAQKVLPRVLANRAMQLVVLGTGEPQYEKFFNALRYEFPRQVAYKRGFSEPLAHMIEAGSDMFLMPSRYEPCGLNQMYSLRYGTVPIVHKTGGLADTVFNFDTTRGTGNGFSFENFDEGGLSWALTRAISLWGTGDGPDRERWRVLQRNGMRMRLSWDERVTAYETVYRMIAPGRA